MKFRTYSSVMALLVLTACGSTGDNGAYESEQFSKSLPTPRSGNLTSLGNATLAGGDAVAAEKIYKQAIAEGGKGSEPYMALANLYLKQNRTDKAIDVLKEGASKDPQIPLTLANLLISEGSSLEALKYAQQAVKADSENPRAYNTQGVALDNAGRYDEAQVSYKKALKLAEGDTNYINNNLALSYIMSDDYGQAISLLKPIAESKDATPTIRQNLALAYGLKGDEAASRKWMVKDLSEDKANENLAFFKHYSKERVLSSRNMVSDETVASDETAVESVQSRELAMPQELLDNGKPAGKSASKAIPTAQIVSTPEPVQVSMVPVFKPQKQVAQTKVDTNEQQKMAALETAPEKLHAEKSHDEVAFAEPIFKPTRNTAKAQASKHEQQASISPHRKDQAKAEHASKEPVQHLADATPTPIFKPLSDVEPSAGAPVKSPEAANWAVIPRPHFKPRLD